MKVAIIIAVALSPVPLLAQEENSRSPASTDPNRVVCRTIPETGSRLRRTRVCRTQAGWDDFRRMQRDFNEDVQLRGRGETRG